MKPQAPSQSCTCHFMIAFKIQLILQPCNLYSACCLHQKHISRTTRLPERCRGCRGMKLLESAHWMRPKTQCKLVKRNSSYPPSQNSFIRQHRHPPCPFSVFQVQQAVRGYFLSRVPAVCSTPAPLPCHLHKASFLELMHALCFVVSTRLVIFFLVKGV